MDLQLLIQLGILVVLAGILVTLIRILDLFKTKTNEAGTNILTSIAKNVARLASAVGLREFYDKKNSDSKIASDPIYSNENMAAVPDESNLGQPQADMEAPDTEQPIGKPKNYISVEVIN